MAPAPLLNELIQAVHDRTADQNALARVAAASEVSGEITSKADLLLGHFVEAARQDGCSWTDIGAALGVTKQGAQQRFVDRGPAPTATDEQLLVRHTERARSSIARAREEARTMGHNYVGTEHLLLGVIGDADALSVRVLDQLGVPTTELRGAVADAAGPRASLGTRGVEVPFTPRARRVLDLAQGESMRLGHNYIGTEHYLLALVAEGEGIGGRVLREHGVDHERARTEVARALSAYIAKTR
jgi:hypothetical protein